MVKKLTQIMFDYVKYVHVFGATIVYYSVLLFEHK